MSKFRPGTAVVILGDAKRKYFGTVFSYDKNQDKYAVTFWNHKSGIWMNTRPAGFHSIIREKHLTRIPVGVGDVVTLLEPTVKNKAERDGDSSIEDRKKLQWCVGEIIDIASNYECEVKIQGQEHTTFWNSYDLGIRPHKLKIGNFAIVECESTLLEKKIYEICDYHHSGYLIKASDGSIYKVGFELIPINEM